MTELLDVRKLLVAIGFAKSLSEAARLIDQGAVTIYPIKDFEDNEDSFSDSNPSL